MARIGQILAARPIGGALGSFLPAVAGEGEGRELRARAAVASTFLAGLELARDGTIAIDQELPWQDVLISGRCHAAGRAAPR